MGGAGRDALRVGFEGTIKLEFHGARVSSDAGLFPYRPEAHQPEPSRIDSHESFRYPVQRPGRF